MTPEQWAALSFSWKLFVGAVALGGVLYGIYKASQEGAKKGAKKGSEVVEEMTASQTSLLNEMAAQQLRMHTDVKAIQGETSGLALALGNVQGEQRALSDGQRALADTVYGLALAHVQLEAIVRKRDPDNERLNALTAKLTPAPPAERRKA